ncbi:MAG: V-type ATP synthase subunit B, partial [Myxococcota bacterium]
LAKAKQTLVELAELKGHRALLLDVSMSLEDALDTCWRTLAECFSADELLMKEELIQKFLPTSSNANA